MKMQYCGPNYVYHNYVPSVDVELVTDKIYDVELASDAQNIIVNGVAMQTEPNEYHIIFSNGAWIPYMPHRLSVMWKKVEE